MTAPVGTLLSSRYRLDASVGTGGMSTVYRGFDTVLERAVAIKLMHREIASHTDQLERFRREARAVAQLNHPHIVTVIDAGEDGGPDHPTPYIVFEFVEGETLKERIRRFGRLDVPEALAYSIEIARALGAAHERGIVHRDVKPQNVLVDEEGSAKVTDFGIARTLAEEGLTVDGRVLGTTDYVSPEQALGHGVTGQSDLYSLGVVLFEMLTGDVPFKGENQVAVAMKHVREELPDIQVRRPEVSAALAAVLDRATAKDLTKRYLDAGSMVADLEETLAIETARAGQVTGEATTVLRTLSGTARRRLPLRMRVSPGLIAAVLILGVTAAIAIVVLARDNTHSGTKPANIPTPPGLTAVNLASNAAHAFDPLGDQVEHSDVASAAIDDDPNSAWMTETYTDKQLGKPGVGLYVDAAPGVAARKLVIRSTPGWSGAVYVAPGGAAPKDLTGWKNLATLNDVKRKQEVSLDTAGNRFRYYLIWITTLPPGQSRVQINDLALFR